MEAESFDVQDIVKEVETPGRTIYEKKFSGKPYYSRDGGAIVATQKSPDYQIHAYELTSGDSTEDMEGEITVINMQRMEGVDSVTAETRGIKAKYMSDDLAVYVSQKCEELLTSVPVGINQLAESVVETLNTEPDPDNPMPFTYDLATALEKRLSPDFLQQFPLDEFKNSELKQPEIKAEAQ